MTWDARKDGRHYYCFVSGGHVVVASRPDTDILSDESRTSAIEDFLRPNSPLLEYIKEVAVLLPSNPSFFPRNPLRPRSESPSCSFH